MRQGPNRMRPLLYVGCCSGAPSQICQRNIIWTKILQSLAKKSVNVCEILAVECIPPPLHSAGNHQHEAVGRKNHLNDDQRAVGRSGDHHCQAHEVPS